MEKYYSNLLKSIGEDVSRPGLKETPQRAAKAFSYLTKGYREDIDKIINNAIFPAETDEMIIVKDIEVYSLCEHHLLPFLENAMWVTCPKEKSSAFPRSPESSMSLPAVSKSRKI